MAKTAAVQIVFWVYFAVLMEWLFFATKPSLLGMFAPLARIEIGLIVALVFLAPCLLITLVLAGSKKALQNHFGLPIYRTCLSVPPAFVATTLAMLLVDNFTYTVLDWGIVKAWSWQKGLYLAGLGGVFLLMVRFNYRLLERQSRVNPVSKRIAVAFVLCSIVALAHQGIVSAAVPATSKGQNSAGFARTRPNIILFSSDGIDADRLKVYGYGRETTPNLDRYLDEALIFENVVSNAATTTAALMSILTGKSPTTSGLFGPLNILLGQKSYEHLPGILKGLGYRTLQETVKYYADAPEMNFQLAFDEANRRKIESSASGRFAKEGLFFGKLYDRSSERYRHLLGIEEMTNVYDLVMSEQIGNRKLLWKTSDRSRVEAAIDFMDANPGPYFIHIHLIEHSHCIPSKGRCRFHSPLERVFSSKEMDEPDDRFDDGIYSSDILFGQLMDYLEQRNILENTVVVYSSDHGVKWNINVRVPLIFLFPEGGPKGRIQTTAQLIDLAPTLLDYLGQETPEWMEGKSLLQADQIDSNRPIFSTKEAMALRKPPYFGLILFNLTTCQNWYEINVRTGEFRSGQIPGHTAPCREDELPSFERALEMMQAHLDARGFEAELVK